MLRKLVVASALVGVLGTGAWKWLIAQYFGRVDARAWEREHPAPPAPPVELGTERVVVESSERVVPSSGLPPEVRVQNANNNLDVVRHSDGRVYLAWRSAPSHFAGTQTEMQVVSSSDEQHWRFEARFANGSDLREPRLLSLGSRLFLYVSRLGKDPFDFEPKGFSVSELVDGRFTPLEAVYEPGYIAWRAKPLGGRGVLVAYGHGEALYSVGGARLTVELLATSDGRHFAPLEPGHRVVLRGGSSETDFALQPDGSLLAVARNEAGDSGGFGSNVCRAPAGTLFRWQCRSDPKKYDSPRVFRHGTETYLLARRNRTADGRYDVARGPRLWRSIVNELDYISEAKRCSLFRFVPGEGRLAFVLDLPSRGDTCFPAVIDGPDASRVVVYDYSSDIQGPDLPWAAGQRRATFVYRHVLRFEPR